MSHVSRYETGRAGPRWPAAPRLLRRPPLHPARAEPRPPARLFNSAPAPAA